MAAFGSHLATVQQNTLLLNKILIPVLNQHPDWVVTVAFYTALHMVEAMFFEDLATQHTSLHIDRNKELQTHRYSHIWYDYRPLYSISRLARYLEPHPGKYITCFAAHCPPSKIVTRFIDGHLANVKSKCEHIIGQHQKGFAF
jgi:hypothetical protein